eukprot:TRINITY_DN1158_c0_g1_i1.p1 TRINITY_DN1158_c0_g1~~TRINITY_DN1158_c0_g1_i1.p1  ORF type:complete len:415 (-),score=43.58 TRINITY_DN1158_c0_g1_i1:72-1316(-)
MKILFLFVVFLFHPCLPQLCKQYVYQDEIYQPWEDWSWNKSSDPLARPNPNNTDRSYSGFKSFWMSTNFDSGDTAISLHCACLNKTQTPYLQFFLYTDTENTEIVVALMLLNGSWSDLLLSPSKGVWKNFTIYLNDIDSVYTLYNGFWIMHNSGRVPEGNYWVDEIALIGPCLSVENVAPTVSQIPTASPAIAPTNSKPTTNPTATHTIAPTITAPPTSLPTSSTYKPTISPTIPPAKYAPPTYAPTLYTLSTLPPKSNEDEPILIEESSALNTSLLVSQYEFVLLGSNTSVVLYGCANISEISFIVDVGNETEGSRLLLSFEDCFDTSKLQVRVVSPYKCDKVKQDTVLTQNALTVLYSVDKTKGCSSGVPYWFVIIIVVVVILLAIILSIVVWKKRVERERSRAREQIQQAL